MTTVSKVLAAIDEPTIPDFGDVSKEAVSFVQRSVGLLGQVCLGAALFN